MAGKQVYMVTDKVTKEVKDMVGEYNEWLELVTVLMLSLIHI